MALFRKRIVIPSAFICILAVLYFALKLLLAGSYVTASVVDSLSRTFNCNVRIDGACLSYNRLTISGLTLSYRKARAIHEIVKIGTMTVGFSPSAFFNRGVFRTIEIDNVSLTIERDSEGWLTFGRIIKPSATLATKSFPIRVRDLRIFAENKCIPVKSATVKVTSAWPRVDVELVEAAIHDGKATGRGWFALEEDPRLEASLTANGVALQDPLLPPAAGDLRLTGTVSCNLLFSGTASSPFLMKEGSWLTAKDVSARIGDRPPVFETDLATLTLERREGKTKRAEIRANLGRTLLDVTPWLHSRDTADHLLVRQRIRGLFQGCPDFAAALLGGKTRLAYETFSLPLDSFSGEALSSGNAVSFKGITALIDRGRIEASWYHQGADMASACDGRVQVHDVDIRRLIEGTTLRDRALRGALSGELRFAQTPAAAGPTGTGAIQITNARLWSLPILDAVAREAKLPASRPGGPGELHAAFALDKDLLRFTRIDFKDGNVAITGVGEIYHSGEVDLHLQVALKVPHRKNVPVVDDFVELLNDAFATKRSSVHVTGTFASPVAASTPGRPEEAKP
ncbi:MAG: AsmA-like C-terminal region-containing protein [Planctomycetes bacterium]|nr:AsmA-like C-terminal region-containing protein [Planctomycetota bacterium]